MNRCVRVSRFRIYRDLGVIACHQISNNRQRHWESFRACYDALVTSGDLLGDYMVTIEFDGETLIVENDGDWAIALLKWPNV